MQARHVTSLREALGHDTIQERAEALIAAEGLGEAYARIMAIMRQAQAEHVAATRSDFSRYDFARHDDADPGDEHRDPR